MQTESHRPDIQSLRQEIINQIDDRIADMLGSLPNEYFEQLAESERLQHFKALVALKVCNIDQEIMLRQQDGSRGAGPSLPGRSRGTCCHGDRGCGGSRHCRCG